MGYTHGERWTKDLVIGGVLEVVGSLGVNRMPSRHECNEYFGDTRLTNVISKHYGWYKLAEELSLPVKRSETEFGKRCERIAAAALTARGFGVVQMAQNYPYDLLVNDCVKVDVKASRLYDCKNGRFYSFRMGKAYATCDIYILLEIDEEGMPSRTMIVPSSVVMSNRQISVGEHGSKYHRFTDRYDLIEKVANSMKEIANADTSGQISGG